MDYWVEIKEDAIEVLSSNRKKKQLIPKAAIASVSFEVKKRGTRLAGGMSAGVAVLTWYASSQEQNAVLVILALLLSVLAIILTLIPNTLASVSLRGHGGQVLWEWQEAGKPTELEETYRRLQSLLEQTQQIEGDDLE